MYLVFCYTHTKRLEPSYETGTRYPIGGFFVRIIPRAYFCLSGVWGNIIPQGNTPHARFTRVLAPDTTGDLHAFNIFDLFHAVAQAGEARDWGEYSPRAGGAADDAAEAQPAFRRPGMAD